MSQKWTFKEHPITIPDVKQESKGSTDFILHPSGRPFRLESIVADVEGFRLATCSVGGKTLLGRDGSDFPATGFFAVAAVGTIIGVHVENASGEKRTFKGRLVGKELAS